MCHQITAQHAVMQSLARHIFHNHSMLRWLLMTHIEITISTISMCIRAGTRGT